MCSWCGQCPPCMAIRGMTMLPCTMRQDRDTVVVLGYAKLCALFKVKFIVADFFGGDDNEYEEELAMIRWFQAGPPDACDVLHAELGCISLRYEEGTKHCLSVLSLLWLTLSSVLANLT